MQIQNPRSFPRKQTPHQQSRDLGRVRLVSQGKKMSAVRHLYGVQKVRGETAGPDPILRGGDLSIRKGSCYICVEIVIPSKISLEAGKHVHATWQSLLYTRMYFDHGNDNCLFFVITNNIHKIFLFSFIMYTKEDYSV